MISGIYDNAKSDRVGRYKQLVRKKQRDKTGLMLVEGISAVEKLLENFPEFTQDVLVDIDLLERPRVAKTFNRFNHSKIATRKVVDAISIDAQGVVAIAKTSITVPLKKNTASEVVVVLNNTQDPGNAGTIIRAAAALGVSEVLLVGESVDKWNAKVIRSSVGGIFQLPVIPVRRLNDAIRGLREKDYHIIAADLYGTKTTPAKPLQEFKRPNKPLAFIFGNEAHGLTTDEINLTDECLYIELNSGVESLNLSGAVHIFLYSLR
ncbi:rRNA methyltransferase [Actinomycetota bacterium]|nr:rRNA methyltransferase [Actinomycetota bacterium]